MAENRYVVCCIPLFCYRLALGDVVSTDEEHVLNEVVESSGRGVLRVLSEGAPWTERQGVLDRLTELGALIEPGADILIALDVATQEIAERVIEFLEPLEAAGDLEYEIGWLPWL